jgi:hypothetical protein
MSNDSLRPPTSEGQRRKFRCLSTATHVISTVHYALETTRATAVCPFHVDVTIRMGDDAAESHAYLRAKNITNGAFSRKILLEEFKRQLSDAADGHCPQCARMTAGN